MLCLISVSVIAVAVLFVGRNPPWVAVFDNLVNNSKMRGNHHADRLELGIGNIFKFSESIRSHL